MELSVEGPPKRRQPSIPIGPWPSKGSTRVRKGRTLLPTAHGNSLWAKIARETLSGLIVHLGGVDMVSETQRLIARRVSMLEAELIFMEDLIGTARGEGREPDPVLVDRYAMIADRQRRLSEPLGWKRVQKPVSWRDAWAAEVETAADVADVSENAPAATATPSEAVPDDDLDLSPAQATSEDRE